MQAMKFVQSSETAQRKVKLGGGDIYTEAEGKGINRLDPKDWRGSGIPERGAGITKAEDMKDLAGFRSHNRLFTIRIWYVTCQTQKKLRVTSTETRL